MNAPGTETVFKTVSRAAGSADPAVTSTPRWGMVIDLNRCVGCQTCTIACKHHNDTTPDVQWRKVIDVETGAFPDVQRLFMVTGCQHCEDPPCVPVCPTGATKQRADGLVTMDYDVCIGCAYCAVSCPYQARTIVHETLGYYGGERTKQEKATAHPERVGVAQKCTFCVDRVDTGLAKGLKPGVDPEATPACSASCVAQAIHFGDYNDPSSKVSTLTREHEHFQMHAELGTDPQIKYLYTTPAVPGHTPDAADTDDERESDPANPLVGALQPFWDWRAAMNWMFGGVSSGLAVMAGLAWMAGFMPPNVLPYVFAIAAILMAVGLFFVFLKIGRRLRFWRAIMRPQSSWMTRELYAVVVFYASVIASFAWFGHATPLAIATIAAAAFLVCQAKILHRARGIPAWRVDRIPMMIVASGLLEGLGLLLLTQAWVLGTQGRMIATILCLVLIAVNASLWRGYVANAKADGIGPLARRVLDAASRPLGMIGHIVPGVLLVITLFATGGLALQIASMLVIAGGAFWKYVVVVLASYQQGFALTKMPQRGSGKRAAPARLDGFAERAKV